MSKGSAGATISGKINLPLIEAFRLSLGNMRMRYTKTLLTAVSISLGIAFLSFLTTTTIILQVYARHSSIDVPVEAYQYWLVFISLLICVVAITNSMLIAVYERYKEIGTMKCIGALDRHILLLFLFEATVLGLIGGVLGFIFGGGASIVTHGLQLGFDTVFQIQVYEVFYCFGFSILLAVVLTIISTLYPAYRAAKLSPVEALRYEI